MKIVTVLSLCLAGAAARDALPQAVPQQVGQQAKVNVLRTPDGGIQPQVAIDESGVVHLIYFKGMPSAGDIYYVRKGVVDKSFSAPIRVNSQPGSAIATGSVRGAHIAVSRGGRVHVAWMGSSGAEPKGPAGATPMLYARMNDDGIGFEPQRNVIQFAAGLDGGGSVAAGKSGDVYVAWHARGSTEGEAHRRVWVARSSDEGRTFTRETAASPEEVGACGCCGMRAFAAQDGTLYIMYRSATNGVDRDMYLLESNDHGRTFKTTRVHPWKLEACPMSTTSISAAGPLQVRVAWETSGQIYYSEKKTDQSPSLTPVPAPGEGLRRKHPAVAVSTKGETLLVWTEKTAWQKGGVLAWQVFDSAGRPMAEKGNAEGVPVWGLVAAFARADGGFTVIY